MCPSGKSSAVLLRDSVDLCSDLRPAFEALDADRDGKIGRDDLRAFYAGRVDDDDDDAIVSASKDDVIGTMISAADTNRDGFVEYEEFERVIDGGRRRHRGGGGIMEDVFRVMDKDGDGRLSHGDLKSYMAVAGIQMSDEDVWAMIRLGSGDVEEGVSYEGFLKILAVEDFF